LVYGDDVIHTAELEIPHPRLHLRRFVLQPLADVWPDLVLPGFAISVSLLLANLKSSEPPLRPFAVRW
jgi:2-amino-4-hydroxy-6-hydroxymethyldihydropteridine diphosphokinase